MAAQPLKCLFVSPVVPYPPDTGGRVRTFRLLNELCARAQVHLRAVHESPEAAANLRAFEGVCASAKSLPRASADVWMRATRPKVERWFHSPELAAALRTDLSRERYDLVHLDEMFLARVLDKSVASPVVVHHHKLDTDFYARLPDSNPIERAFDAFKLRRLEAESARRFRFHALTNADEARELKRRYPSIETSVVESGFDEKKFQPPTRPRADDELLFLGSLDYAPNIDGLGWFLREVLPKVRAERPNVHFCIVGSAPTATVRELAGPRVSVIGRVGDVVPHLQRASALIVPLRIGGGTRLKIVEAMGCATPIVSTSVGAEGLAFENAKHLLLADTASAFAARTLEVLRNPVPAAERADAGRVLALERYKWSDLAEKLLAAWQRTIDGQEPGRKL